jgi:Trypsin-co-occurring domain 1
MGGQFVPMTFGGVKVLVETVQLPGTEPTSTVGDAGAKVLDAFDKAQEVIVGAAVSTVGVMQTIGARAAQPDRFEVEFGIAFSVKGNVIIAGASADTTLKVKLTYDAHALEP